MLSSTLSSACPEFIERAEGSPSAVSSGPNGLSKGDFRHA